MSPLPKHSNIITVKTYKDVPLIKPNVSVNLAEVSQAMTSF